MAEYGGYDPETPGFYEDHPDKVAMRARLAELENKMAAKERKKKLLEERARLQAELASARTPDARPTKPPSYQPADGYDPEKERRRAALRAERDRLKQQLQSGVPGESRDANRGTSGYEGAARSYGPRSSSASAFGYDRPARRREERPRHGNAEDDSLRELKAKVAASQMEAERAAAKKIDAERRAGGPMPSHPPQEHPYAYQHSSSSPALSTGATAAVGMPPQYKPAAAPPPPAAPPPEKKEKESSGSSASGAAEGLAVANNALVLGANIARIALAF